MKGKLLEWKTSEKIVAINFEHLLIMQYYADFGLFFIHLQYIITYGKQQFQDRIGNRLHI